MASLKEVKTRIASVTNTRKITSAMKMVASSKLHHAQKDIEGMRPYEKGLERIMTSFISGLEGEIYSPYAEVRPIKHVAIVLYTSNGSLCGGFNANAIKAFLHVVQDYKDAGVDIVRVIAIGAKGQKAVEKAGFTVESNYCVLADHPSYDSAAKIAEELMNAYVGKKLDEVKLIYHHFMSSSTQELTIDTLLPINMRDWGTEKLGGYSADYIVEPGPLAVMQELIPKALHLKVFTALLDNIASEHAARVIAMQVATDNADDLLQELKLKYNKTRQQAITNELLDIVAGSAQQ